MNIEDVDRATRLILGDAHSRVLSPFMLGANDLEHVDRLLQWLAPPDGARILDAGCGTGEVARLMLSRRPDLQFTLLNVSAYQLGLAPDRMRKVLAPYEATMEPDGYYDVVLFSQSIEHAEDMIPVLREAARVTRRGGLVAIFGMADAGGDMQRMRSLVDAHARDANQVVGFARLAGLSLESHHDVGEWRPFDSPMVPRADFDSVFDGVKPHLWRFTNAGDSMAAMDGRLDGEVAFQFSGGRDSMAALWVMRPYWDRMKVYHLDTGDQFPETRQMVEWVRGHIPVITIKSDVASYHANVGWPTDVIPVNALPFGRAVSGERVKVVGRFECCMRNLMQPMHQRMLDDGITLIVRGQRDADYADPPTRSGFTDGDVELLYPIQSWSTQDVNDYCTRMGLPMLPWYADGVAHGSDCMRCTAWWDDGRMPYVRAHHPDVFREVESRLDLIFEAVTRQCRPLYEGMK